MIGPILAGNDATSDSKKKQAPKLQKKENVTLEQWIEVLNWHHNNGANQTKTAKHFNEINPSLRLTQPKMLEWLKKEPGWCMEHGANSGLSRSVKRIHQTLHSEITDMLDLWVSKVMSDNILLTGKVLRQKWRSFADHARVPVGEQLSLSNGWLARYKFHMDLKQVKWHGKAGSTDQEIVQKERLCIQGLVKSGGYRQHDIFNADETGLFYECVSFNYFALATNLK